MSDYGNQTYEAGEAPVQAYQRGKIILHRKFEGEHNTTSPDCWCRPHIIEADDLREAKELIKELEKADG